MLDVRKSLKTYDLSFIIWDGYLRFKVFVFFSFSFLSSHGLSHNFWTKPMDIKYTRFTEFIGRENRGSSMFGFVLRVRTLLRVHNTPYLRSWTFLFSLYRKYRKNLIVIHLHLYKYQYSENFIDVIMRSYNHTTMIIYPKCRELRVISLLVTYLNTYKSILCTLQTQSFKTNLGVVIIHVDGTWSFFKYIPLTCSVSCYY